MITSRTAADVAVGALCACALAASFPPFNAVWLMPLALAGIFWTWRGRSMRSAALLAFLEGTLYFTCVFSWFGETVGAYLGPFAFIAGFGPAVIEAPAFAIAAAVCAGAARTLRPAVAPLAAAVAFALCEAARTSGTLGVPFGTLAEPLATTVLAPLAAIAGGTAMTLAVAVIAAYLARAAALRGPQLRGGLRALAASAAVIASVTAASYAVWPAKTVAPPSVPVAAIQGNIRQDIKWNPATLAIAVDRYVALTRAIASAHPRIVVWPESVITTLLNADPALEARFAVLARDLDATLIVGTDERDASGLFDSLYYFGPAGRLDAVYRKRRLVPFAEYLPAEGVLRGPIVALERAAGIADPIVPSSFASATADAVVPAGGLLTAPLICWESGFADVTAPQIAAGAQVLIVATDDAWFGETGGPYQHAQLAQLRAVETGRWVIRAAATGISGIIAPDGRFTHESTLDTQAVEAGAVGPPQPTIFARTGPHVPFAAMLAALVALVALARRRRSLQ